MRASEADSKAYLQEIRKDMPKTKHLTTMARAFLTGGVICCIGQGFTDGIKAIFPTMEDKTVGGFVTMIMILLTAILTGFGVYDKIGAFGGAGSIVPITGFANSIVSPAIEHKREGIVLGLCANMFSIAGPVIVFGVTASVLVGIIYCFL